MTEGTARTNRGEGETRAIVADLLARAITPREIAKRLDITTQAVYLHMAEIRKEAEATA